MQACHNITNFTHNFLEQSGCLPVDRGMRFPSLNKILSGKMMYYLTGDKFYLLIEAGLFDHGCLILPPGAILVADRKSVV